jgi:hypothetical protein
MLTRHIRTWGTRFRGASVLLVLVLVTGCGGADTSPTDLSGLCRVYASSVTATTNHKFSGMPPSVDTKSIAIVYNTAANQLVESGTGTNNNGLCQMNFSWTTNYRSVVDFVYEVSVNSPETRWVSQSGMATYSGPSGPCGPSTNTATFTNSYDSQGKLASSVSTGGGVAFLSTVAFAPGTHPYTDWDVFGRPTAYAPLVETPSYRVRISYDDAARTRTTVMPGNPLTTIVESFDPNGNLVRSQGVTHGAFPPGIQTPGGEYTDTSDTVFAIHATSRACR